MGLAQQLAKTGGNLLDFLAAEGRVFYASDADQNDLVTGQTSFVATTPTFILDVPTGTTVIPLMVSLGQSGTVAGDDISVIIEIDNADRYNTGGTAETIFNSRTTGGKTVASALYSGATANAGFGARIMGVTVGPDVSPAEGISNEIIWTPPVVSDFLVGPAALLVYTYAGTTGPTWLWAVQWAEMNTTELLG